MRHKARTSEYQRSFQIPEKEYCKTIHEELFAYRSQRRQLESSHEKVKWDSFDTGSSGSDSSVSPPCPPDQGPDAEGHLPHTETVEQGYHTEGDSPKIIQAGQTEDDDEIGENSKSFINKIKIRELKGKAKQEGERKKPPFVPYGWADKEMDTARKLTHNVKADNRYVYPSALKKQEIIKTKKICRKKDRAESKASIVAVLETRHKAIVSDIWMTEYQRCYSRASTRQMEDAHKNTRPCQRPFSRSRRIKTR